MSARGTKEEPAGAVGGAFCVEHDKASHCHTRRDRHNNLRTHDTLSLLLLASTLPGLAGLAGPDREAHARQRGAPARCRVLVGGWGGLVCGRGRVLRKPGQTRLHIGEGVGKRGVLEHARGKTGEKSWLGCGAGEDEGENVPQGVKGCFSCGCIFLRRVFPASSGLRPEIVVGLF